MNLEVEADLAQLVRLKNSFDALPVKIQRQIVREETRKAVKAVLLPKLRASTPVRTGRLRKALAIRAIKRARNKAGVRMALTSSKFQAETLKEAARGIPFYAGFLEWGWRVGKRTRAILAAQRLVSRRNYKENVGLKKDGTLRSATKRALSAAQDANANDKRRKIEGSGFMRDVADRYGDETAGLAAREMAKRIQEEFKKL